MKPPAAPVLYIPTLERYRLTTANILYHLPDFPSLLQSFLWQKEDIAPEFPALHRFLKFWEENLEGKLHSVWIVSAQLIRPEEFRYADMEIRLQ